MRESSRDGAKSGGRPRRRRANRKERSLQAFGAYVELLDTASWMRRELRYQLNSFDLTMEGFRILEMLYREGPMTVPAVSQGRRCTRQNVFFLSGRLAERGWVEREVLMLPPVDGASAETSENGDGKPREGRRIARVRLTPAGQRFIGTVFPRHAKVVLALMRALNAREQKFLRRLCRKLREGDVRKFLSEITHVED
jgi:DNA-binding MarR family transcriptional regulator